MKHCLVILLFLYDYLDLTYSVTNELEYCESRSWIKFEGNCYHFPNDRSARLTFYDAEEYCRGSGSHFLSIHSEAENNFVTAMVNRSAYRQRQWIGLNNLTGDGSHQWTDDTLVDFTKIVTKEFYDNQRCFIFMVDKKGWRPEDCGLQNFPVCKRSVDDTPATMVPPIKPSIEGNCPENWIQFGEKCYKYFGNEENARLKYREAKNACRSLGNNSELVSIHSMEEQAFLTQHLYDLGTSVWIGIRKLDSDEIGHEVTFGWVDNSRVDFTNWATGHPPPSTWKYCGSLSYEGIAKGEWVADYCENDKKGYICQRIVDPTLPKPKPEPPTCPSGWVKYRNSCYRSISEPQTYQVAEQSCQSFGGHLVSISDGFEQAFLYNFIVPNTKLVWNGLSSVPNSYYLKWSDNSPFYYSNWVEGQPNWKKTNRVCSFLISSRNLTWDLRDCSSKLPYVCETANVISEKVPEVQGQCPNDKYWIDIGDKNCYHVGELENKILSWDSTLRYCMANGMQMIKIQSLHQVNSLIAYLWKESIDINLGMIRMSDKRTYVWLDGSALNFINWDYREPSDYPEARDCVAFSQKTGRWKTIPCSTRGIVLCQTPKVYKEA